MKTVFLSTRYCLTLAPHSNALPQTCFTRPPGVKPPAEHAVLKGIAVETEGTQQV